MMKKLYISFLAVSIFTGLAAQSYTQSFNEVFQNVDLSHTSTGILYERVLPVSNLYNFIMNRPHPFDTCDYWQFVLAYEELYRAGAQNIFLSDSVEEMLQHLPIDGETVVIGILHMKFNTFDTAAVRQRLYYDSDSVLWENTSVNVSLFQENNVFMAAPLVEQVFSRTVRFVVDGNYSFDNTTNPITTLKIDFDDGSGEKTITNNTPISVVYLSEGIKILRITSSFLDGTTVVTYSKIDIKNNIRGGSGTSSHPYTEDLSIEGEILPQYPYTDTDNFVTSQGEMRIYFANADMILRKPVLIVDGFDPLNNRRFDTCYAKGEKSLWDKLGDGLNGNDNVGELLLNLGYDVVMLDFPEGGTYIEQNAMVCIKAINTINERLQQSGSGEQIVVVGPSMGGQITRYALAYMEQHPNANTNYGKHNCRLWISFDSPHQGANISIGVQKMVENYRIILRNLWEKTLCCKAAKQMLIYHKKDGADEYFNTYYQQMAEMGYSNSSRKIAISNGSLNNISNGIASYEALILDAIFPYFIDVNIRNMSHQGSCNVYEIIRRICFIPIRSSWSFSNNGNKGSLDVAPGCKYYTFDILTNKMLAFQVLGLLQVVFNQHTHCFMPTTSVLDINAPIPYATDVSNIDLVAEGIIPFDSYWGPLNKNMEHITFDYDLVDYLLNEIETYIVGQREIQLCTRPCYTMHLPQSTTASVTWYGSDNIQIVPTNNPNVVNVIPLYEGDAWICADVSTLGHKKNLAHYPIHISNNTSFTPTVSGTTIQGQSMLVDDTRYLASDTFCVENGKTLTVTGTLYCAAGTRLIVRPGGTLIVDGGTLTSACADEMWQGIEVAGDRTKHQTATNQGTVILQNGASIENAHCAIRTGLEGNEWLTAGGIVQCSNSTFTNNRRAVSFYSYADTLASGNIGDNKSWFKDCTFTLNNDNLFLSQNMEFLNHVTLWDVKGVSFEGCTFENLTTGNIPDRKHAIYAENAGFKVKTLCNTLDGCNCYGTADTNRFTGFSTAVEACNAGSPYAVTIDEAKFVNNATGVSVQASNYATVTRCVFDLSTNPLNGRNVAGLLLSNTIGYHVEGNAFTATPNNAPLSRWGVHVNKSMKLNNSLYRNSFRNLNRGISVTDTNGLGRNGLCFSCNTFEDCAYGIYVSGNGIIASMQGNLLKGVDNSFTGTQTSSLYNLGPTQINYYHSSNTGFILHLPTGVYTESDLATANPCNQTVCDQGGNVNPIDNFAGVDMTADVAGNSGQGNVDNAAVQMATSNYYAAVRGIMRDSVENLQTLAAWHSAAGIYADPYSLTEVATALGTADVSNISSAQLSQPELDNFMAFRTLAATLRPNVNNPAVNWPAATPAQVAELQRIAEANTGRSSSMAKGVLCFFFDICYEEDEGETKGHLVETFHGTSLQNGTDGGLLVYPNPTDGMLYVALSNAEESIGRIVIANLTGREVAAFTGPGERIDVTDLPAGVYLITVTTTSGNTLSGKFVKTEGK